MAVRSIAPAKINLALNIKNKRDDNYHEVDMVMQSINIYDYITVEEADNTIINVECKELGNCNLNDNIAYKAAEKFFEYTNVKNKGVYIHIKKNIPICAGLAGGSSDGAAVILSLDKIFCTGLKLKEMYHIGSLIGADVPFCMMGGTMRARGIGDKLEKLEYMPDCAIIVVKPNCNISTKYAYNLYDKFGVRSRRNINDIIKFIEKKDLKNICKNLFNDFESLISEDKINKVKIDMLKYNPQGVCMSGSGPSVFGVFDDLNLASLCFNNIKEQYKEAFICTPLKHGAKIIEIY